MSKGKRISVMLGVLWPAAAMAHGISWQIAALFVLPPIGAILLSVIAGVLYRSWRFGLLSLTLVALWLVWFWAASAHTTSDVLVWIPIAGLVLQVIGLIGLVGWRIAARLRT